MISIETEVVRLKCCFSISIVTIIHISFSMSCIIKIMSTVMKLSKTIFKITQLFFKVPRTTAQKSSCHSYSWKQMNSGKAKQHVQIHGDRNENYKCESLMKIILTWVDGACWIIVGNTLNK